MPLTDLSSIMNFSGWRQRVTSFSIPIREAVRVMGQEFGNIIQYHYPATIIKIMVVFTGLVKRGYVDEKRSGVTGGSGGGLLTNWTIGKTTRFAAAVSQRDIADWADRRYTADFTLFQPSWFKAPPFEDPGDYRARSPITYISKVQTPLMLILGETDYRTPTSSGGEQMFAPSYLIFLTVMVRFPNETPALDWDTDGIESSACSISSAGLISG